MITTLNEDDIYYHVYCRSFKGLGMIGELSAGATGSRGEGEAVDAPAQAGGG